jgi:BtpA family/Amidase
MAVAAERVRQETGLPMGINVLANAALHALAAASAAGARFVRINQWANAYVANEGLIEGAAAFTDVFERMGAPGNERTGHAPQGRLMAAFHQTYDLLLSPTLAKPPVPLGTLRTDNPDLDAYRQGLIEFMPFTQLFNMPGQPSMTVPLHWSEAGRPIGVMFSAQFGDEATLFRVAAQLERAKPWFDKIPALLS